MRRVLARCFNHKTRPMIAATTRIAPALWAAVLGSDETSGLHRYMPNAGFADVRTAIAESLSPECKVELSANDVVMVCGAAGGLNITLKTLVQIF